MKIIQLKDIQIKEKNPAKTENIFDVLGDLFESSNKKEAIMKKNTNNFNRWGYFNR